MKKLLTRFAAPFAALASLLLASVAFAQQATTATPVQQTATRLDTCGSLAITSGLNASAVLILQPPAGQYVYICAIDLQVTNDATGGVVQTQVSFTSSGIGNWTYTYSSVNAANTNSVDKNFIYALPVKSSTPGARVTLVSPPANLHASYNMTVYSYSAP